MTTTVKAVYAEGKLELAEPVDIPDGTAVEVILIAPSESQSAVHSADVLARIAALPAEPGADGFSGSDHDRVLYPR